MSDDVRIGLIGAGRIARVHAQAYRAVSRGRIVACTDPVKSVARSLAADYGFDTAEDFDALLSDPGIDAVLIATPNDLHADQTIAALRAGKHVFCQKPIALSLADADRVVREAEASDRIVQFGFMLRFTPPLPDLQKRIASGELGDAIAARAAVFGWEPSNDWFYDPKHGGGVILDTLVHFGDLVLWLFGPAAQVYTQGGAYVLDGARRYNSPDNATVTVTHASGVVSSMYVSWTTGYGNFSLDVFGTAGSSTVDLLHSQGSKVFLKPTAAMAGASGWGFPDLVWTYGYTGEQQYFVDRVAGLEDGKRTAGAAGARSALELVLAAQHSLDENRVVTLP
ncbi:MAG TPA: Gfo/Idh/MocA family oxidoreductase [Acidothermaceae bacterium]